MAGRYGELALVRRRAAECPDDPEGLELRADDPEEGTQSDDRDRLGELIAAGDTRWSLDLDDPYAWRDDGRVVWP